MLSAIQSMIFAISAGFSDRNECDTDSLIVTHLLSVRCGNIVLQMVHHSCECSSIISRSSGVGRSCRRAAMSDFDLLYCALVIVTGTSFRVMTALSNSAKAGALVELRSPGIRMVSSTTCALTGLRRLFRTSATKGTCQHSDFYLLSHVACTPRTAKVNQRAVRFWSKPQPTLPT